MDTDGTHLTAYSRTGAGRLAVADLKVPDVRLDDYQQEETDEKDYDGLDRFGRIKDQYWDGYGGTADVDRFHYTHDNVGNRTWKENTVSSGTVDLDELYDYDDLYRLIAADRGQLTGHPSTPAISSPDFEQDWTLDGLGNWSAFDDDGDSQTRDHNAANEIDEIDDSGTNVDHDDAGNMTAIPQPGDDTEAYNLKYDAWNRLVEIEDAAASVVVAKFEYDGTGRRILKIYDSQSLGTPDGVDACEHYLHSGNQVIETRQADLVAGVAPDADAINPKYQNSWGQAVNNE